MADTIFTKIIKGEIPCHKIHEDEHTFAFLDINPISPGHTLIVPKEPAPTIGQLSDNAAAALGRAIPRVARAIIRATGTDDINILINSGKDAGQDVPHVHAHLIPKHPSGQGLSCSWNASPIDHDEAAAIASDIAANMTA